MKSAIDVKGREGGDPARDGWDHARARATTWAGYEDGWDGEGSFAPSRVALAGAGWFAGEAERCGITQPAARLHGDGEVEFAWEGTQASASVSFLRDGYVVAYVRRSARHPMFRLDRRLEAPDALGTLLSALREALQAA